MRFLLIILILVSKVFFSQNLVPNPSFESYTMCPTNYGQIANAVAWDYIHAANSSEYYNACSSGTQVSVPKNFFGANYQLAKTGNAYAGIQTLTQSGNFRGNICAQLSTTLSANSYYYAKFYAVSVQGYKIVSNNLALSFSSTVNYTLMPNTTLNLPMHIYKFGNPVLKDTLNWIEVKGIYKATGIERFIIIGNFMDKINTKVDTIDSNALSWATYYMIDDVSVEPICTPFWSYRDTTVAIGDSVLIGPAITGLNINWYDATSTLITNAPGIYVKPAQTTTYTAVEDFCGNTYTNTIVVTVTPTAVKEYENNALQISLHPNPANDIVTITSKNDFSKIELLNVTGQVLLSETVNDKTRQINLNGFSEGIYFVKVVSANGMSVTKKVVKQ
jgi:hypothetical protein